MSEKNSNLLKFTLLLGLILVFGVILINQQASTKEARRETRNYLETQRYVIATQYIETSIAATENFFPPVATKPPTPTPRPTWTLPPSPTSTPFDVNELDTIRYVSSEMLTIYAQPDIESQELAELTQGMELHVTGSIFRWFRIEYDGGEAWVIGGQTTDKAFNTPLPTPTASNTPRPTATDTPAPTIVFTPTNQTRYVTAEQLNIRAEPDPDAEVLGTLSQGNVLFVTGEIEGWYRIRYGTQVGWVSAFYTSTTKP